MRAKSLLAICAAWALVAACGQSTESSDTSTDEIIEAPTETAESESQMDTLFDPHIPWDSDRDTVVKTESGLEYIILVEGEGEGEKMRPKARDTVEVMYEGRLARTGEVFDSSYARGQTATFPLSRVIAGWTEGLQYLGVGDQAVFFIPANLAYGDSPRPGGLIQPGDDLVFIVELKRIEAAPEPRPTDDVAWDTYTPWDGAREGVQTTESGLQYVVLQAVEEGESPALRDEVVVYYEGRLDATGDVFDSAFQRGEPAIFPAGRLIPGFVEALSLMKSGERWLIHIPSDLGYGPQGTPGGPIPPNADLNFEVELIEILAVQ